MALGAVTAPRCMMLIVQSRPRVPLMMKPIEVYSLLDNYTRRGYQSSMQTEMKTAVLKRLSRIEGQVRGLARMAEDDRYCIDIVTQISAVKAARCPAHEGNLPHPAG